jgi:hypothetical protein
MEGVLAACVAFVFVCVIFPQLIRNRSQFYAGFGLILLSLLLLGLARTLNWGGFINFANGITTLLLMGSVLLLFLGAGGITWGGLAAEMKGAIEVMRRGETEKEVIIPKRQVMDELEQARAAARRPAATEDVAAPRPAPAPVPPPARPEADRPIPLE